MEAQSLPSVVVHQPRLLPIIPLPHDDMPYMMPLAIDLFKPPHLIGRPPIVQALRQSLHMLPFHIVVPGLQEVVFVDIRQLDPPALTLDLSEYPVLMLAPGEVEKALFLRGADAAGGHLGDVDVGVFLGGVVDVLVYGEGDGGVGDGFAEEPGYALLVGVLGGGGDRGGRKVEGGYHLEDAVVVIG